MLPVHHRHGLNDNLIYALLHRSCRLGSSLLQNPLYWRKQSRHAQHAPAPAHAWPPHRRPPSFARLLLLFAPRLPARCRASRRRRLRRTALYRLLGSSSSAAVHSGAGCSVLLDHPLRLTSAQVLQWLLMFIDGIGDMQPSSSACMSASHHARTARTCTSAPLAHSLCVSIL